MRRVALDAVEDRHLDVQERDVGHVLGRGSDDVGLWADIDRPPCVDEDDLVHSIRLDGDFLDQKIAALRAHASQTEPLVALVGVDTFRDWWRTESFVDVQTHRRLAGTELIGVTSA